MYKRNFVIDLAREKDHITKWTLNTLKELKQFYTIRTNGTIAVGIKQITTGLSGEISRSVMIST